MRLLLDTHVWLWWTLGSARITRAWRSHISASDADVALSAASAWELAIKYASGRISLPFPPSILLNSYLPRQGFTPLAITLSHALGVEALPFHHADPFDRIIIAQAIAERRTLVTADRQLGKYPVTMLAAK